MTVLVIFMFIPACDGEESESLSVISKRRSCRANLNTICTDQAQYRDAMGQWATSIDQLDQLSQRARPLTCPESGEEYLHEMNDSGYILTCPAGHGSIETGVRSWTGEER